MDKIIDCSLEVSKFKLLSFYYVHFRTNAPWERYEPLLSPPLWVKSITAIFQQGWR